jgi:L-threonylcarbamoyladenylate synthase
LGYIADVADILPITPAALARAAEALRAGGLVVIPTETVYGLAADATNARAIARLFAAKGRPHFNPLIAHIADLAAAEAHAHLHAKARALAQAFWPGPLTLVAPVRAASPVCDLARAGLDTIALRAPRHPVAQALLRALPFPLAAPSANRSGHVSPTTAAHAAEDLGDEVDLILDAGPCAIGIESTVIAIDEAGRASLLRAGAVSLAALEAAIGPVARARPGEAIAAPGMLTRHYAPRARLRLGATDVRPGETRLGFGPGDAGLNLSPRGDLEEAAANLYAYLRQLDAAGAKTIAVAPIPNAGLGEAINDRLARAAQGR